MPSVAPIQVKTGAPAPPDYTKSSCKELHDRNQKQREKLKKELEKTDASERTKADADALGKAGGGGMTFSSAMVNVGMSGGGSLVGNPTACSSGKAFEKSPSGVVDGGTSGMKTGDEGVMCGDPKHKHPPGGAGAHAEAKIMNELTKKALPGELQGGSILLNIDWRFNSANGPHKSGMPCRLCFKTLCHAQTKCKIQIFICDKNGEPAKLGDDCDKQSADPRQDPYAKLDSQIDPHPKLGRGPV